MNINQTENGSVSLGIIDARKQGAVVIVRAASTLGGGTITIGTRSSGDTDGVIEVLDATLIAGSSATYTIGASAELFATLSGASSPNVTYVVNQY